MKNMVGNIAYCELCVVKTRTRIIRRKETAVLTKPTENGERKIVLRYPTRGRCEEKPSSVQSCC